MLKIAHASGLESTAEINLAAGATLDVAALETPLVAGPLTKLTGVGNIAGPMVARGTVLPGAPIGTLTFGSNLSLLGRTYFQLQKDRHDPRQRQLAGSRRIDRGRFIDGHQHGRIPGGG